MSEQDNIIKEIEGRVYKYGFTSDIETETIPRPRRANRSG